MTPNIDVIIAGGGRVGFQTATLLAERGDDITIIEQDPDVVETIAAEWVSTVIKGDASDPDILEQAGIADADVIAGLTGESGLNLAVCLAGKELSPGIRTVARIDRAEAESYTRFVDAVCFPEQAGGRVAANAIADTDVQTLVDVTGTLDILEVRVAEGAPAAGKTLSDIRFPAGTLVISDDDGERIARPETTVDAGKRYVVAVEPDVTDEVINLLRG